MAGFLTRLPAPGSALSMSSERWQMRRRLAPELAGLAILCLSAGIGLGSMAGGQAKPSPPARVVVGLKQPWSPRLMSELRRVFKERLLSVAPSGAYVLVLLKRGQTLADIRTASPAIQWVEPETAMSMPPNERGQVVIIEAPQIKVSR